MNEAADALAKIGSSRQPVPTGIFATDQHKPSIRYVKGAPVEAGATGEDTGVPPPTHATPDLNTPIAGAGGQLPAPNSTGSDSPEND